MRTVTFLVGTDYFGKIKDVIYKDGHYISEQYQVLPGNWMTPLGVVVHGYEEINLFIEVLKSVGSPINQYEGWHNP